MNRYAKGKRFVPVTDYKAGLYSQGELCSKTETDYNETHSILKNEVNSCSVSSLQRINGSMCLPHNETLLFINSQHENYWLLNMAIKNKNLIVIAILFVVCCPHVYKLNENFS